MNTDEYYTVWEIKGLKGRVGSKEALKMLENVVKYVQPIMRKHKFKVELLSEICPTRPNILGLNHGKGKFVELLLRNTNKNMDFLPFDEVMDTMLHELSHNVYSPHNASFYNLWNQLRQEYKELMKPLGGDSVIMNALSPVQAAAMAAERRLHDYEVAKNIVHKRKNVESSSGMWQCLNCTLLNKSLSPICELCDTRRPIEVNTKYNTWSCNVCTLENNVKLDKCSACDQWRYSYACMLQLYRGSTFEYCIEGFVTKVSHVLGYNYKGFATD